MRVIEEAKEGFLTVGWENGEYTLETLVRFIHEVGYAKPWGRLQAELNQFARPKGR